LVRGGRERWIDERLEAEVLGHQVGVLAPVYRKLFAPSPVARRFAREFPLDLAVRPSEIRASAAETALMIPGAAGLAGRYPEPTIPVAIVAGLRDKVVDCDRQAGRQGAELPHSTLRKVPDAGHMIHHIVPEQVAAVILDVARAAFERD
jgi:pimeloyl-ACP methyl ester carboxylesterase